MKIVEIKFQKISNEETKVVSRVDIHFDGFWLKGFKVVRNPETHKEYVTPPSYHSPKGWRMLFSTDDENDWKNIQASVLAAFSEHDIKLSADETQEKTQSYK